MLVKMVVQFSVKIRGIFVDFYTNICEEKNFGFEDGKKTVHLYAAFCI